jgi:hypothetical protein
MLDYLGKWTMTLLALVMLPIAGALGAALHQGRLQQETPDLTCELVEALLRSVPMEDTRPMLRVDRKGHVKNPGAPEILLRNYPVVKVDTMKPMVGGNSTYRMYTESDWTPAGGYTAPSSMDELVSKWPHHLRGSLWRAARESKPADLTACDMPLRTDMYMSDPITTDLSAWRFGSRETEPGKYTRTWWYQQRACNSFSTQFYIGRIVSEPGGTSALVEYRKCGPRKEGPWTGAHYKEAHVDRAVKRNGRWEFYPVAFSNQ